MGHYRTGRCNKLKRLRRKWKRSKKIHKKYSWQGFVRYKLFLRDGPWCCWCQETLTVGDSVGLEPTLEHVVARSKGGLTRWNNLALACGDCNSKRGSAFMIRGLRAVA